MRKRCSIMWCPWKAKYSFGLEGYYECWFHGGNTWRGFFWDMAWIPVRFIYSHVRYGFGGMGNIFTWYKQTWNDFFNERLSKD